MNRVDVLVVGAGMAGASIAAEIAPHATVAMIEAEPWPGCHATGRAAGWWVESHGGLAIAPLTRASGDLLRRPPAGFADQPLLTSRGALHLGTAADAGRFDALRSAFEEGGIAGQDLDAAAIAELAPMLEGGSWRGLLEPGAAEVDVEGLHAAYLRMADAAGARLYCGAPLREAQREQGRWRVDAGDRLTFDADILIDAAGAWADTVARIADVRPVGIQPRRRTISALRVAPASSVPLPRVIDIQRRFAFWSGPEKWLMVDPLDETPSEAGNATAEEMDAMLAVGRIGRIVHGRIERVERTWAGLCSYAPDGLPVYGFDPRPPGFFWFAGQGDFGIQTAPAAARIGAALVLDRAPDRMVAAMDGARYAPGRFVN